MNQTVKKAVILCGGLATRFLPISKSVCKEMLPVLDKPVLQILVEEAAAAGINDVLVILGRNKEIAENHFDRNIELEERLLHTGNTELLASAQKPWRLANMHFVRQLEAHGTGFAVLRAKSFVGQDPFLLLYGDELLLGASAAKQVIEAYQQVKMTTLLAQEVPQKEVFKYGILAPGSAIKAGIFSVSDFVEKPQIAEAPSCLSYMGAAVLTSDIFTEIEKSPRHGLEVYITDAYKALAQQNKLHAVVAKGQRYDLGNPLGLIKANIAMALKTPKYHSEMIAFLQDVMYTDYK